jgi:hypothetical protein
MLAVTPDIDIHRRSLPQDEHISQPHTFSPDRPRPFHAKRVEYTATVAGTNNQ